ncbi:hypothetical protein HYV81_03050 [Candidatus Woesearchaeota archaeon]|nr:hypothetical protein [Candidatus Woesearchaeota archaeon]
MESTRESPCPCGGAITWRKENVSVKKEMFRRLDVGLCDTCHVRYLSNDSADLVIDKLTHENKTARHRI